jgi:hypothetical protein
LDEKTGMQALDRKVADLPMEGHLPLPFMVQRPGHPPVPLVLPSVLPSQVLAPRHAKLRTRPLPSGTSLRQGSARQNGLALHVEGSDAAQPPLHLELPSRKRRSFPTSRVRLRVGDSQPRPTKEISGHRGRRGRPVARRASRHLHSSSRCLKTAI